MRGGWTAATKRTFGAGVRVALGAFGLLALLSGPAAAQGVTADLRLSLSHLPDPVVSGTNVEYQVSVFNAGPDAAGGATLTVTLPAEAAYVSDDGGCLFFAPDLTCPIANLPADNAIAIHVVMTPTVPPVQTTLNVHATVSLLDGTDPNPADNVADQAMIVGGTGPADLALKLFGPGPQASPSEDELLYDVVVENLGDDLADTVKVRIDIFGGAFSSIMTLNADALGNRPAATCTPSGPTDAALYTQVICTLPGLMERLGAGQGAGRWLIQLVVEPAGPMFLSVEGAVTSLTADPIADNNFVTQTSRIADAADVAVTLAADPPRISPGQEFALKVGATNFGPSHAENVLLFQEVPAGFVLTGVAFEGGTASCTRGTRIECTFGDLALNETRTLSFRGYVKRTEDLAFLEAGATLTSALYDHNLPNNYARLTIPVRVGNQLGNPSFERDPAVDPRSWVFVDPDGSSAWDCGTAAGGSCSVSFAAGTGAAKRLYQMQTLQGLKGDRVELSGWSKAQAVTAGAVARLQVTLFNSNGTKTLMSLSFPTGTHGWQKRALSFVAPRSFYAVTSQFVFQSTAGKVWLDNASLVIRPQ